MSTTMTVAELVDSKNIALNPTTLEEAGNPLVYEMLQVGQLKIDRIYQRMLYAESLEESFNLEILFHLVLMLIFK